MVLTRSAAPRSARRRPLGVGLLVVLLFSVAACGSGGGSSAGPSGGAATKVTPTITAGKKIKLSVWTFESDRFKLIKQRTAAFEKKYPDVSVTLVQRSSSAYSTQVTQALSGRSAPDVVEGNNGFALDAALVKGGLIRPLDSYAAALGWLDRYPAGIRKQWQLSSDGSQFGSGKLYGVGLVGELGGWFYNKQKLAALGSGVPTTQAAFEALLAKAKAKGETPVMLGNVDGWEASHVFNMVNDQTAPVKDLQGIAFTDRAAKWDSAPFEQSAATMATWARKGYFPDGYDGFTQDDAIAKFAKGDGVFLQCGSWCTGSISDAMGTKAGYFLPPPLQAGGVSRTTGSLSTPFHVSSASQNPQAAVLYVDWISNRASSELYAENGDLPGVELSSSPAPAGSLAADVFAAYQTVLKNDALMPYPDWSLPQTGSIYYAKLQEIIAGKTTPSSGLDAVQRNRIDYYDQQRVPR